MKYCIKYFNGSQAMKTCDEIIIRFIEDKHSDAGLLKFIEKVPENQRIIINMLEAEPAKHIKGLIAAKKLHKNLVVMLEYMSQEQIAVDLWEENIPYFYINGCENYNDLNLFINNGATDVYIINDLCFNIKDVSKYCHDKNVKVRVIPNKSQYNGVKDAGNGLTSFWIRPEDEFIYNDYIDVYEFYGNIARQDVLYRIYKSHQWLGDLAFLIDGLTATIYSDRLIPHWGEMRSKCGKRCGLGKCESCLAASNFAKALEEKGTFRIKVKYPKDYDKEAEILLLNEDYESKEVNEDFTE